MPRQARIDYPGALQHVIGRGIERKNIFGGDADKKEFLRRLKLLFAKRSMQCYAWCIMDNHYHLLLVTGKSKLSELMRCLLTGYGVYYNKVNKRSGYVFQNRYKSIVCDRDEYLLSLIRYIHLNPVRVKKIEIEALNNYKWTGHKELVGKQRREDKIVECEEVLSFFSKRKKEAKRVYIEYVKEGVGLKEDYMGGGLIRSAGGLEKLMRRDKEDREMYDERILGNGGFIEDVYAEIGREESRNVTIKGTEELLDKISKYYGKNKSDIIEGPSRGVRGARSVFIYIGYKYLGKRITELGDRLRIGQSAASMAMKRGKKIVEDIGGVEKIL